MTAVISTRPEATPPRAVSAPVNGLPAKLAVEYWPLSRLRLYERNPRRNDKAVDRMVASIREFGFAVPCLAKSDGECIDGHLRAKAAAKMGMAEVPVIPCDGWTDAQVKAFRLMVNRSVGWAEWDDDILAVELADLKALDFDLSLTGFDLTELDRLLLPAPSAEEDAVPEVPAEPVSRLGDLWLCGPHRVMCGDSTDAATVAILLGGQKAPFLMATDPPYGVEYDPEWRDGKGGWQHGGVALQATGVVRNDETVDWHLAWEHFPGDVAYVWHAGNKAAESAVSLHAVGFLVRTQIIWVKQYPLMSRGHYNGEHEPCWYAVRKGRSAHWHGDLKQSTVWKVNNLNPVGGGSKDPADVRSGHGTQKPVELFRRPILNHTTPGEAVYDPFLGSGTAVVAAEATGRICYGVEISEAYCDVIVHRWMNLTHQQATLDGDGRVFDAVAESRVGVLV